MARKKKEKVDVLEKPSDGYKKGKSFRRKTHFRKGHQVSTSKPIRIEGHERQERRTQDEIQAVIDRYLRTGKLPKKVYKNGRPNPNYIRDLRVLQRAGVLKKKKR